MEVIRKHIPGVEITLWNEDAAELAHILRLFKNLLESGNQGSGTAIQGHIKLCNNLGELITEKLKA